MQGEPEAAFEGSASRKQRVNKALRKLVAYGWSMGAMLLPAVLQFALFAFYARALGVEQYGVYIALLSWNPICFELVGLGAGEYLVKRTAHDESEFGKARGHMLAAILYTMPVAMGLFCFLAYSAVDHTIGLTTITAICFCEFLGFRLLVSAEQAAIALRRFVFANWIRVFQEFPGLQVCFSCISPSVSAGLKTSLWRDPLPFLSGASLPNWLFADVFRQPVFCGSFRRERETVPGSWATNSCGPASKTSIALSSQLSSIPRRLPSTERRNASFRSECCRSRPCCAIPIRISSVKAKKGMRAAMSYGLKVLPVVVGVAIVTAGGLIAVADVIPLLVGAQYAASVTYLLYLAPILLLFALNYVATDTLSGGGHLFLRTVLTASGVGLQALLFFLFHDGKEIVLASYGGMVLTCLLTWASVLWLAKKVPRTNPGT